ncbi:putative subtilisin-like protease [Microdochium trichocladiopsis]|uniref:Subtilisin-like protease n=1 Tax=Microdochium trichocladiopsis TaxID=1682393 RepID=A0A9P8Y2W7_9PEZI|nr:putative subtilisin-like protease [Microdochium trichocladiopsis]KAH7026549.1 putative subtilisin-like protease [Microdochium trichocladiopsis]
MVGFKTLVILAAGLLPAATAFPKPYFKAIRADHDVIAGQYIVTLNKDLDDVAVANHFSFAAAIHARSGSGTWGIRKQWRLLNFAGYSGHFDDATVEQIRADPSVFAVEPNRVRHLMAVETQKNAPWGLASISNSGSANSTSYLYEDAAGEGQFAYIVDTGILDTHEEFEGERGVKGYNAVDDVPFEDVDGHGTHVAGTICGKTYGVAKKATCVSVKVFNGGSSTTETVMEGYNWAVQDIKKQGREANAVISMSLGGGRSDAENRIVEQAFNEGILTIVAAGNDGADASEYSPASAPNAVTVGAADISNTRAYFSNFGDVVDIFAPGVGIKSAWIESDTSSEVLDGTSMATPHISGLVLYLKSVFAGELDSPGAATKKLLSLAVPGIKNPKGADVRAYNGVKA